MKTSNSITIVNNDENIMLVLLLAVSSCIVPEVKKVSGNRLSGHTFVIITHKTSINYTINHLILSQICTVRR